jgi:diacylglycerol kinase family enzyme/membrane-associated phospholipid phosphatase
MRGRVRSAVGALDRELFRQVAQSRSPVLDAVLPPLTRAADHSVLWMAIAGGLLATRSRTLHRAARRGLSSVAVASFLANQVGKRVLPRRRPVLDSVPIARRARRVPASNSFPSGHAASAAAFAVGASLEAPALAVPLGVTAAAVGVSRAYTGVHYPGDVLAGATLGAGVALAMHWLVPSATRAVVRPRPTLAARQPARRRGDGVVLVVNPRSGQGTAVGVASLVRRELPDARVIGLRPGDDPAALLRDADAQVLGVIGGDGTVGPAARVAMERDLPLLVVPGGTFNHFAADLSLPRPADAIRALRAGTVLRVDVGTVEDTVFVNTLSVGAYPEFVRIRERYQDRLGKPVAAVIAFLSVRRRARPVHLVVDGDEADVWLSFVGNGRYEPRGFAPVWRPRLNDGLLDLRLLEDRRGWRRLPVLAALLGGRLGRSRAYVEDARVDLVIERDAPGEYAHDGEVSTGPATLRVGKRHRALVVYAGL